MKNSELALRVKELRNRQGFSQEQLVDESGVSLRTIQRIENGESEPRGDTLKRLAQAFKTTPDELIDWAEQEDKGFLTFFNLSALSFFIFPLLGVILPLALWILKKDKIKGVDTVGRKLLNFEITLVVLYFLYWIFRFFMLFFRMKWLEEVSIGLVGSPLLILVIVGGLYVINGIYVLLNSFRLWKGLPVFYKPAIPFLGR